jgi:N-acyl-D-amino-acid deacylase
MFLKNATIIDGSGKAAYQAHILIDNDKITKILPPDTKIPSAKITGEVIDCTGKYVTPGFIDSHSHNDFFVTKPNKLVYFEPFIRQGVTTMVAGNCGFSAAGYPVDTPYNSLIGGGLFSNDGKNYGDFQSWAKSIDGKMPINLVALVGHGTVRIGINGKSSNALSEFQMKQLGDSIENSLKAGAAGVSFGLMYEPGQFAPLSELEYVASIAKKYNKIVTFHARACSKVSTSYNPPVGGRAHNLRAMDEVIGITKKIGVKTEYSHLIFVGKQSWSTVDESLKLLEQTKKEGFDISFDMYPMEFGASVITVVLPVWYMAMTPEKRKSPFVKARLWLEIQIAIKALGFGFEDMLVANTFGKLKELEGMRVTEIAKQWKKSAFDTYLELIDRSNAKINVLMYKYQNEAIIEKLRTHPQALYMSDAWIEEGSGVQNFACYYAFPKFLVLARDNKTSIEDAVRKMTGAAAERFGIQNRGLIQPGYFADLVVFDLKELDFIEGKDLPPVGIHQVINNGKLVVKNGVFDGKAAETSGRFVSV